VRAQFEQVPNLEIYFLEELHAKCYLNERNAVITSLNLLNSSEAINREMGVLLNREQDAKAYEECKREVESILSAATPVNRSKSSAKSAEQERATTTPAEKRTPSASKGAPAPKPTARALPEQGFCIRCGDAMDCDPDAPLCLEDFKVWVRHKNPEFVEKRCHTCGKSAFVSMADPMCNSCSVSFAGPLRALDSKRKGGMVFGRPTWRLKRS
jgi:chaperonin cofactor prefoldin